MELTVRELNRATLARQLLLERRALAAAQAVERLCAVQAQWPNAPYVALWSRVRDFDRDELTRAREKRRIVRGTLMRVTIHLLSARDYLALAPVWRAKRREEYARQGGDVAAAEERTRAAVANGPRSHADLSAELGDAYSPRFGPLLPLVHEPPAGTWRYHGPTPLAEAERWLGRPLGDPGAGARLLVERYLAGYGPASRRDLIRFSGLRVKDVEDALAALEPRLRRYADEDGRTLLDLPRLPLPTPGTHAPVRFLGRWDNAVLGYDRRARILPDEYAERKIGLNGDQVFLVDGFVAGIWTVERARTSAAIDLEPLAPLPQSSRREVEAEARDLLHWHEPEADAHAVRWS